MKFKNRIIDPHSQKTEFRVYGLHDSNQLIIPRYVGVTMRDPIERLNQHINHAIGSPVENWIREKNFNILMRIIRYTGSREEMYELERNFIRIYPNLLNTSKHNR